MKFYDQLPAILAGTAITSALVFTIPQTAYALTGREVNAIAREITVLFRRTGDHGSGFIIARNGNTYYVLTANHVVPIEDQYSLMTSDQQAHAVDYSKIRRLPGVDLAVVEFTSDKDYRVAQLGTATTSEGQDVFVSGWPALGNVGNNAGGGLTRQFTNGQISGYLPQAFQGYQMTYTNVTRAGMSGGPVLDAGGRVVGIHGMGETEDMTRFVFEGLTQEAVSDLSKLIKPGFNYAIPISTYLQLAPQAAIYLNIQVDGSPAPELGEVYTPEEPDPRDTVQDINRTFDTIDRGVNTIQRICGLFGC